MTDPNSASRRTDNNSDDKNIRDQDRPSENLFKIMDGVIDQLNVTKRMFIIMILSIMILPPIALIISFTIADAVTEGHPWFFLHRDPWIFLLARNLPLIISLVWLGIGIRQWFVISSWAKRYQRFKETQRDLEKKLADEDDGEKTT